jgi:hypothetical protein
MATQLMLPGGLTAAQNRALVSADRTNLLLNPSFETVLPGTHTAAIHTLTGSATTKNSQYPGWKLKTLNSADSIKIEDGGTTITGQSQKSVKITTSDVTGKPQLVQYWTAAEYLQQFVAASLGTYLNVAFDVKLGTATASAARLFVTSDGTGGTITYSSYHGNNTDWERLFVSAAIPSDATYVYIGISFESTATLYYIDNGMVIATATALTALPYVPRVPVTLFKNSYGASYGFAGLTDAPTASTWYATNTTNAAMANKFDINATRPAWANGSFSDCSGVCASTAYQSFRAGPSGSNDYRLSVINQVANANAYITSSGTVIFGVDGQVDLWVEHTDCDLYYTIFGWIGEGL